MIAPLREPGGSNSSVEREPLRVARRIVAAALLKSEDCDTAPRIAAWKAWAFVGWLTLTALAYALSMLGINW